MRFPGDRVVLIRCLALATSGARHFGREMVPAVGIEPTTYCLQVSDRDYHPFLSTTITN